MEEVASESLSFPLLAIQGFLLWTVFTLVSCTECMGLEALQKASCWFGPWYLHLAPEFSWCASEAGLLV